MPATPTFVFDDDGKAYAYVGGKIVASADDADELERKLAEFPFKKNEDDDDEEKKDDEQEKEASYASATHVVTPNGLRGTILGKQKGLWGDQVTIRLENGRITRFDVTPDEKFEWLNEKRVASSPLAALEERLNAPIEDQSRSGLVARVKELKAIKHEAAQVLRNSSYSDETTVGNIMVFADHELREITDALAALEDAEPYAPPAPFETNVVEQESMGGGDSTWLDHIHEQMVNENEAQDFDKLMEEGPDLLIADLETPALEDAVGVEETANGFVSSHTAGLDGEAVVQFRKEFVQRVRQARTAALKERYQESERVAKEASTQETYPDEGLFL